MTRAVVVRSIKDRETDQVEVAERSARFEGSVFRVLVPITRAQITAWLGKAPTRHKRFVVASSWVFKSGEMRLRARDVFTIGRTSMDYRHVGQVTRVWTVKP